MNIQQTINRSKRIGVVEKALRDTKIMKRISDEKDFIIIICEQFACSVRTSREYIKIAKARIKGGMQDIEWAERGVDDGK